MEKKKKKKKKLEKSVNKFQSFYQNKYNGRKLNWSYQNSKGEVKAHYPKKASFLFTVSAYQIAILLQYNDHDAKTIEDLVQATALEEEVIKQVNK